MLTIPSEIRNLLKSDSVNKNFRVHFPNGERADITNDNIVDDSITFGESICSSEQLQFGLCETPTLEFETVGVENIKGAVIECSMEVIVPESLSSVTGVTYKSDINKWVYSLPYGTFIVDSCKKQSDMTHRRITTYNTFAYKSWDVCNFAKDMMTIPFYWYQKDLKLSMEGLMKMIFPDLNASYLEISHDPPSSASIMPLKSTSIFIEDGYQYRYSIQCYYYTYEDYFSERSDWKNVNILNYKIELNNMFCESVKNIVDTFNRLVEEKGLTTSTYVIGKPDRFVHPKLIKYTHYTSSGDMDYYLNGGVYAAYEPCTLRVEDLCYPLLHKTICSPYKLSTTDQAVSFWETSNMPKPIGIRRVLLLKQKQDPPYDIVAILDSNEYTPRVFLDINSKNFNLFNSPSGLYFPISYKKTTLQMTKYPSSGSTSTVSKTLYLYDWSNLVGMDNKEIVQSYLELQGKFGLVKRDGNIDFISVNEAFNTPDDTIPKSEYETIWYDDYMSKPYGRISATYTNENNESTYTYLNIVEDFGEEKYKTYDISNNFFIKNYSRTEEDIQLIFTAMSLNIKDISFMPMQITMKGRPDLEAGDVILIESDDQEEPIVGFMMQRRLTGVESLRDEISSQDEISSETVSSLKATYNEDTETLTLYAADTRR